MRLVSHALPLVPLALVAWIVAGVLAVPAPPELRVGGAGALGWGEPEQRRVFAEIARHESRWRLSARRHFPRHAWSAEDDYHWNVQAHVERVLAKRHEARPSRIWAVYDRGVHRRWRVPESPACAGRPRFFGPLDPTTLPLRPRRK